MAKLPRNMSGRDLVKHLEKIGYAVDHQRGSHIILERKEHDWARLEDDGLVRVGINDFFQKTAGDGGGKR